MRALLLGVLAVASAAPAADWPMLGRTGDRNPVSLEKNAPTDWDFPIDGKPGRNIKWSVQVKGSSRCLGGPVVAGGFVWVGGNENDFDAKIDKSVLACIRASDGKEVYRHVTPRGKMPSDWPTQGLSGSPLIEGDRLWFVTNRREVVCLDLAPLRKGTGKPRELWKLEMVKAFKVNPYALMIPGHDTYGSPASHEEFLYISTGNGVGDDSVTAAAPDAPSLVCLRKDTGKLVWSDNSPGNDMMFGHSASPTVITVGKKVQVVHPQADGWVRSFDAETGKLIWKFDANRKNVLRSFLDSGDGDLTNRRLAVVAAPVFANGRVYFGTGIHPECAGGPGRLFCIDPTKAGDVSPELPDEKAATKGKPNPNSAVVREFDGKGLKGTERMHQSPSQVAVHMGFVIAADCGGVVHCLDERTGKQLWAHDTKGQSFSHPLIADGKIYVASQSGFVHILELAKAKKVLAKHETSASIVAPPVFADGVLFVLSETSLTAIPSMR